MTLPKDAQWSSGISIFLRRYCPGNFGHLLLDAILPAFVSFYTFYPEYEGQDPGIIVDDLCSGASLFEYNQENCENVSARLLPFLSDNVHFVRSSANTLCFEEMVSSNCKYGLYSSLGGIGAIPNHAFKKFRGYVWRRALKFNTVNNYDINTTLPTVLVTFKNPGQRRRSVNMPEVSGWLQETFNGQARVILKNQAEMPLSQSITLLSGLFLFVTPAGGTAMSTVFLPSKASVIVGTFCDKCDVNTCGNWEVGVFFQHLEKLDVHYDVYPVRQEDMVHPREEQGCNYRMGDKDWLISKSKEAYVRMYTD